MAEGLTATPLGVSYAFNWYFLVEIIVVGILALFFLFYFNRLIATVISYAIRLYSWHAYRAYIDISALQISPLGGRIFFKSIRYHAQNITVLVHDGHITWRYWLRNTREPEILTCCPVAEQQGRASSDDSRQCGENEDGTSEKPRTRSIGHEEEANSQPKKQLPCRVHVHVSGVEAFIYNRSPVYDAILEDARRKASSKQAQEAKFTGQNAADTSNSNEATEPSPIGKSERADTAASIPPVIELNVKNRLPPWLAVFPIGIECRRAAGVLGNENTTSVLTAKAEQAVGTIDVGQSGPLDLYKLLFNFDVSTISVAMRPNRDYKRTQSNFAKDVLNETGPKITGTRKFNIQPTWKKATMVSRLDKLFRKSRNDDSSLRSTTKDNKYKKMPLLPQASLGQHQWQGLARYLDYGPLDEHEEWQDVEYAKASSIAEIGSLNILFYFDMPGTVPKKSLQQDLVNENAYLDDINGSKPPDYGLDFHVKGGVVTYGPWADRQRINFQQIFMPASYLDADQVPTLKTGEVRTWSVFKIFVGLEKDLVLRIPSREPSKDAKWRGRAENTIRSKPQESGGLKNRNRRHKGPSSNTPGADIRPYGWIDIVIKTDTSVTYNMDMFPRSQGYRNKLSVDATGTEITSSVNHGLLWETGRVTVDADLSQPRTWNTLRSWPFNITIDDMQLFILRDHLFLIIDLVNDWSSGAPPEFHTFVPYRYDLHLLFRNFSMFLNVNDANIVNDPADFDRNDFLTLEGVLDSDLSIDMEKFRPVRNKINFDVLASNLRMRLLSPPRTTLNTLLHEKQVATLPRLTLSGSYSGHIEQRPGLTDTLHFDIVGTGLSLTAYGFLVRQLINIKENYFGDYLHFKTLEEFQGADDDMRIANSKTASIPKPTSVNELDVILCIVAEDAKILFPTNIYSSTEFLCLELPTANLDLRILSYYLDMGLQLSPISIYTGGSAHPQDKRPAETQSCTQLYVKHMDLDGHRFFGQPPNELAYVSQWRIDIGAITGEFSSQFVHDLAMAGRAFLFAFPDMENSLLLESPTVVKDVTFVQVRTDIIKLWIHLGDDALVFACDPVEVTTNDLVNPNFSQRVNVLAPYVMLAIVDGRNSSRRREHDGENLPVRTYGFLQTGASITITQRSAQFSRERMKQQAHIRSCDQRTHRALWLIQDDCSVGTELLDSATFEPPCMPYPSMSAPIDNTSVRYRQGSSIRSAGGTASTQTLRSKLSQSSLSDSIRVGLPKGSRLYPQHEMQGRNRMQPRTSDRSRGPLTRDRFADKHKSINRTTNDEPDIKLPQRAVAFSSLFSEPHFPMQTFDPDESRVPVFDYQAAKEYQNGQTEVFSQPVNDPDIRTDIPQMSVFVQVVPGIRAYIEPRVSDAVAKLLDIILNRTPEETMDAFHMDVLETVSSLQVSDTTESKLIELSIGVPSVAIRIEEHGDNENTDDNGAQTDVVLRGIDTLVRMRKEYADDRLRDIAAVYTTVQHIHATLSEVDIASTSLSPVDVDIRDLLIWVATGDSDSIHVNIGESDLTISGEQASFMIDLALRLVPLVEQTITKIQEPLRVNRNRHLLLVQKLLETSDQASDPPFFATHTILLRVSPNHFRNQDSWKVIMRFRQLLQALSKEQYDELCASFNAAKDANPREASFRELQNWAQWRNWDIPNINQTVAFQTLFNQLEGKSVSRREENPLALTIRSNRLRLAAKASQGSTEIVIEDFSLGVELTPPIAPEGLLLVDENTRKGSIIQLHMSSVTFVLDWSLYTIVEALTPCIEKLELVLPAKQNSEENSTSRNLDDRLFRQQFHLIVSTDVATFCIQSINLRYRTHLSELKLSLIGTTKASERYGECISGILNAKSAFSELQDSNEAVIWQTGLRTPSIYVDRVNPSPWIDEYPSLMIALSFEHFHWAVEEQAPGLIRLVDSILLDEVSHIARLIDSVSSSTSSSPPEIMKEAFKAGPVGASPKIHVALLADHIEIEFALLSTLSYRLNSRSTSVRVAPSITKHNVWGIDFDIGGQNHVFVNTSDNKSHEQKILDVPHFNGHIGLDIINHMIAISAAATMEKVDVDATVIQDVANTLSRPEVKDVVTTISSGIEDVRHHIEDLSVSRQHNDEGGDRTKAQKAVVFDVRFALLGIRVAAKTPLVTPNSIAEVDFGFGALYLKTSNETKSAGKTLLLPELRAQIHDIGAHLRTYGDARDVLCGSLNFSLTLRFSSHVEQGKLVKSLTLLSDGLELNSCPDTASTAVDVINQLQDRLKRLDLSAEVDYLRRLRESRRQSVVRTVSRGSDEAIGDDLVFSPEDLLAIQAFVELRKIQIIWLVDQSHAHAKNVPVDDLVLSLARIEFTTRGGHEARLSLEDMQLSLAKRGIAVQKRSLNSAILPNVSFSIATWSTDRGRDLALKAVGKPLEIRLESKFISPINAVHKSIKAAIASFQARAATWQRTPTASGAQRSFTFDIKHLNSILVEAEFAGAQVFLSGTAPHTQAPLITAVATRHYQAQHGQYGQFGADDTMQTALQSPGVAFKVEYNSKEKQPTVNGELLVDASSNKLLPNVIPLLLEVSNTVKEVVRSQRDDVVPEITIEPPPRATARLFDDESSIIVDPTAVFGKLKVDLGLRVCKQEFALTCQPIARVDAMAELEDFYLTMNTVHTEENGQFFALSTVFTGLSTQVKHMYSREPTFDFDLDSIVLSVMNNKHLSDTNGLSAILKIAPARMHINGKQVQDLLLFREIWIPPEIRSSANGATIDSAQLPSRPAADRPEEYFAQRYQQIASAAPFPWNVMVSITELALDLDLGQSIGKSSFTITDLWASQAKASNSEQSLCIGLGEMAVTSTGRMSGFVQLNKLAIRTAIKWPDSKEARRTPLIQASIGFDRLRAKAAFDYQPFAFGDIERLDALMYNVREKYGSSDRLVAIVDCEKAYVFCTSTSPAQAVALYQAFDRLVQEKQMAFVQSLKDIEKQLSRENTDVPASFGPTTSQSPTLDNEHGSMICLHTDVVLSIGVVSFGVFPSTFFDSNILKLEADNIQARFGVDVVEGKIRSALSMTLGQLQVALASARRATTVPKALDVSVDDVITSAVNSRGGVILRVPKVVAAMQTWQVPDSNHVDYIFKSLFAGKIDVGWNLSRINFIKGMWTAHSRTLASQLGKALPESAVKITARPVELVDTNGKGSSNGQQEKITAQVTLPQSRYEYHALEPPIIETPQLRDMGEATPPLEWIGLQRDRLPHVTHQIIIVSLIELAKEVGEAYEKILGSS